MCGIAGVISGRDSVDLRLFQRMLRYLAHRGPDSQGVAFGACPDIRFAHRVADSEPTAQVALGHQRLAIIDLSDGGWQPMSTPDGRYHIVYNGEVYNYRELRAELERCGRRFRSRSDTEVVLSAYAQWGVAAFPRFVGMFALAILDTSRRTVVLARDFFGIKPVFHTVWRDGVAFASEIGPLLELPGVSREVHPERLLAYLRDGLTDEAPHTLLSAVKQLPPAHWLEWSLDDPRPSAPVRYWELPRSHLSSSDLTFDEAAARLRDAFLDSVELHLRSDVPVGVALSGGIDSSSILAAVRQIAGREHSLHAFSYVAADPRLSEERWVDRAAADAQATVHKVRPQSSELAEDFECLSRAQGEPFGSTSIYAQYRIFQAAQQVGVKVMLDGQGADELMGGYRGYLSVRLASLLRQRRWNDSAAFLRHASRWPGATGRWIASRAIGALLPVHLQVLGRRMIGREAFPDWLNAAWFAERGVSREPRPLHGNTLNDALIEAVMSSSLPALLRYEDRNSMAFSIGSRVPFLTPAMAQFLLALPEDYLVAADGTSKALFRRAMRGIVSDAILDRRDKVGFETSERDWLLGLRPWIEWTLKDGAERVPAFNAHALQRAWQLRLAGRRSMRSTDSPVWRWINLTRWSAQLGVAFT